MFLVLNDKLFQSLYFVQIIASNQNSHSISSLQHSTLLRMTSSTPEVPKGYEGSRGFVLLFSTPHRSAIPLPTAKLGCARCECMQALTHCSTELLYKQRNAY